MNVYSITAAISQYGSFELKALPFWKGEVVEVISFPITCYYRVEESISLAGKPLIYIDPFEPVAEEDWEALK